MTATQTTDARHGFEFWHGRWHGYNRKLVDVFDPDCEEWIEFDGVCEAQSVLTGLGSIDTFVADMPGRGRVDGLTVRLFNPATNTWKIWWVSTGSPGDIGVPVEGSWVDGRGQFFGDEERDRLEFKVQFEWTVSGPDSARWRQFFSFDGGETWKHNWTVEHTRVRD